MTNNKIPCAIITGIHGQGGFYLTRLLLSKGYKVVGIQRRSSSSTGWRLLDLPDYESHCQNGRLIIEAGDITDYSSIARIIQQYNPDEFYNLAAQSQVWHSFKAPIATCESTGMGTLICIEAIKQHAPNCRFYQASSSEMFGNSAIGGKDKPLPNGGYERVLNEDSQMIPRSPYGAAKLMAHSLVRNYREAYGLYAVGGILFNHESPYRGVEFVTRKITHGIASILTGDLDHIELGNIESYRDWGHAEDYMNAAWLMLQQDQPVDYVIASGETHSIREFLDKAFRCVSVKDWSEFVRINPEFVRPSEVDVLIGDPSKALRELNWKPQSTFNSLVEEMVRFDCARQGVAQLITEC